MSDSVSQMLDGFAALCEVTLQIRDLVRTEQWDLIEGLVIEQNALVATLPLIDPSVARALPDGGRQLAALIGETAEAHDEVIQRALAWRGELSEILLQLQASQGNVTRLNKAYQQS